MRSMTGFGRGRHRHTEVQIAVVNHRSFQVVLRGECGDLAREETLRKLVRERLGRGAATVLVVPPSGLDNVHQQLEQSWRSLAALAHSLGAPVPTLGEALAAQQRSNPLTVPHDVDSIMAAAEIALTEVEQHRRNEGKALADTMNREADTLDHLVAQMRVLATGRVERHHQHLSARLTELLTQAVPPETLTREMAIYAERIDVGEELDRLAAHLIALRGLLESEEPGKNLEFLMQECSRELSTTAAKSHDGQLTALVLAARLPVDRIREQAANVL